MATRMNEQPGVVTGISANTTIVDSLRSGRQMQHGSRTAQLLGTAPHWLSTELILVVSVLVVAAAFVLFRANWVATPDGDPALHLKLIQDIAANHALPSELPRFPARIGDGGEVEAMFPYSYPPFYHIIGAGAYAVGGLAGVLTLNAIAASIVAASVLMFLRRVLPWLISAGAALAFLTAPPVIVTFQSPYMEPLLLALLFSGTWLAYFALTTRRPIAGLFAGILLGLSVATRQNALLYVCPVVVVIVLHVAERGGWRRLSLRQEIPWFSMFTVGGVAAAVPALMYLVLVTGSIGYGDVSLPGMTPTVPIDPAANDYLAGISKPSDSPLYWIDRYRATLLYTERWAPYWASLAPLLLFVAGVIYLHSRTGASRFFAHWALLQITVDILVFATLHGNWRYVIASQVLFHTTATVGAYAVVLTTLGWYRSRSLLRLTAAALVTVLMTLSAYEIVPRNSEQLDLYLEQRNRDIRTFRGNQYAQMADWVNHHTPEDALILTPRAYTAVLTWDRDVTWITYYGNSWVLDAIESNDPLYAHAVLQAHGVDYVVIPDPPGTYMDAMPANGMRSLLQLGAPENDWFELVHVTTSDVIFNWHGRTVEHGLRLYRVKPTEGDIS